MQLTVRDALELPHLRSGAPEVITGTEQLDQPVRWAHVAEARNIASVVKGGELLITEGRLFTTSDVDRRRLLGELAEREIAAIVLELGDVLQRPPRQMIDECRAHGIVLVVLHLPVPFIEVTEEIQTQIVNYQSWLLATGQELQERLTSIVLSGGSVAALLDELADALQNPVVFERRYGGLVYQALHGCPERDVTAGWQSFVRDLPNAPRVIERKLPAVADEASGRLVTLGLQTSFDDDDTLAVERGASAVSLLVMRDRDDDTFSERCRRGFLTALLEGQIAPINVESRAVAAGFNAPVMMPIAVRMTPHHRGRPVAVEERLWQQVWTDVLDEMTGRRSKIMLDPGTPTVPSLAVVGLEDVEKRTAFADQFASVVMKVAERHLGEANAAVVCVGAAVHTWHSTVQGLHTAVSALESAAHSRPRLWHDAMDIDLDRLIWSLRGNPDLERFARLRLDNLIQHDRQRGTQFVTTLKVLLEQNGQKAETARALYLERQSLYNRVQRIEGLLDADLTDPDTRLGLHLALRVLTICDGTRMGC